MGLFHVRIRRWGLLLLTLRLVSFDLSAADGGPFHGRAVVIQELDAAMPDTALATPPKISRGLAAGLAVLLGPLGAHRIYLGTQPKVPVFYTLTFGGFGVLVLIDLAHILFTKDLDVYRDSRRMLMWAPTRDPGSVTPP
ncbi:MAG: TM2 domain-containing protein [Bacteroidetes bacterium]|nr:TM2 domain-containing protein [Bacteroidota bacterium]MBX7130779.1 TM2 domain-containing protein [Flavobacteriales bacterium]HND34127.1 TM2 domain-containing protein [Myxococcota bacterium]MCC6655007.1 TM2 domain-containing protein [Flavobacteriales bacterium]HMU13750.1 TM2 domain-containing protein [Flavobacteriales bacterium]